MTMPLLYVDPPSFTPLPYGLLSTLRDRIVSSADLHWQHGIKYETLCASSSSTYDECLVVSGTGVAPAAPPEKAATAEIMLRGATPFTVYAEVDCSAPGFWDRAEESVLGIISQSEQRAVENALWTGRVQGAHVVHPHLASNAELYDDAISPTGTDVLLDTAASIVVSGVGAVSSLGALEDALADCYDGVGVIHIPRSLVYELTNINAITLVDGKYVTANGNIVVVGSGYPGTAPDGTGTEWMYATGAMMIYRSVVRVFRPRDSIERDTNTVRAIAEITYVIGWDCCHLAASIAAEVE